VHHPDETDADTDPRHAGGAEIKLNASDFILSVKLTGVEIRAYWINLKEVRECIEKKCKYRHQISTLQYSLSI
jgi:hypothetical protein